MTTAQFHLQLNKYKANDISVPGIGEIKGVHALLGRDCVDEGVDRLGVDIQVVSVGDQVRVLPYLVQPGVNELNQIKHVFFCIIFACFLHFLCIVFALF